MVRIFTGKAMNREQLLELGIDAEKAETVLRLLDDDGAQRTERAKANELEKEQLRESLKSYEAQLNELKNASGNADELKAQIARLEAENQKRSGEFQKKLEEQRTEAAVRVAMLAREHRPHDAEIVAGLLDLSQVEVDERGNVKRGLEKQLEALEEKRPFLFDQGKKAPTGVRPGAPNPAVRADDKKSEAAKSIGRELAQRAIAAKMRAKSQDK